MRVKMLTTVQGADREYEAGETYTFPDDQARGLIAKRRAVEVRGADGASAMDDLAQTIQKAVAQGFAAGAADLEAATGKCRREPPGGGAIHQGEYSSPDVELAGVPVFGSKGGFLHAVKDSGGGSPTEDTQRKIHDWGLLVNKATRALEAKGLAQPSGNFEASDPDGGVLVIPEFSQQIYERMQLEENFLGQSSNVVVRGNTLTMPALDDSSRTDGNRWGAVIGAWANEAEQLANVSKAKFRQMDLRLKKLYIFAYLTDELLSDSAYALESYVARLAAKELAFKTNDAMIRGTGAGTPLGVLNSGALITVPKETGQAANTIVLPNVEKMWMRLNYLYRKDAVWLINQDCEAALQMMAFPVGTAGVPIYQPQGGVSNPAYATLKGRPVKIVEFCETLGTVGDILLVNWDAYQTITKGGIKSDVSMHVRFQYGEMAYRFTFRMDGQPLWDKPLTPYKGTTTTSPFVALATRS